MGVSAWGSSPDPDICNIDMRVICANIKITDIREPVKKVWKIPHLGEAGPGHYPHFFPKSDPSVFLTDSFTDCNILPLPITIMSR